MKKQIFGIFSLALFYLAGMYRYPALMVLAVFQILLFIFLTLQVHICKRQLQVRFVRRTAAAVKEVPFLCELSADYKGKLPAGCIRFYLQCGYGNQKEIKRLYGNVGKDAPGFALCFPYCGTAVIRLQKFRVYDYLFLGSVQKELSDEMQIMVFPKEKALSVRRVDGAEEYQEKSGGKNPVKDGNEELHRIREYRAGDPLKQLHWKLSARAENLLIREYERQEENAAGLFLDLRGYHNAQYQEKDAFYELLSALLLGLLLIKERILVCWREEGKQDKTEVEITESAQCREVLRKLYQLADAGIDDRRQREAAGVAKEDIDPACFILDMQLRLFQGNILLYQFSGEYLEEEIQKEKISIL